MWVSCFRKVLWRKSSCHSFFRPVSLPHVRRLSLLELLQDGLQGKSGTLLPLSLLGHSVRRGRTSSLTHWDFCTHQFLGLVCPVWTDHYLPQPGVLDLLVPGEPDGAVSRTPAQMSMDWRTNVDWRMERWTLGNAEWLTERINDVSLEGLLESTIGLPLS